MDDWHHPNDTIWALQGAATSQGFMPHAESTAEFLRSLERSGLVMQSDVAPVWYITDKGRAELAKLEVAKQR